MRKPKIAALTPVVLELAAGEYAYCSCGESERQPFCDGSHDGTGFEPRLFTLDEARRLPLCRCKRSKEEPYCDGAHRLY